MDSATLKNHYLDYISCLNRRQTDLSAFVHDDLIYNSKSMSRKEYQDLIAYWAGVIPDQRYDVDILVVADSRVACRINFACTPVREMMGLAPTGRKIQFSEHVFYRFEDGKIKEVWSLIDKEAITAQLS